MAKHKKWQTDKERKCLVCGTIKPKTEFETYQGVGQRANVVYMKWSCKSCPPLTSKDFKKKDKAVHPLETPKMPEKRIEVKKAKSEALALLYNIKYSLNALHVKVDEGNRRIEELEDAVSYISRFMKDLEDFETQ